MDRSITVDGIFLSVSLKSTSTYQDLTLIGDDVVINSSQFLFFTFECQLNDFKKEIKKISFSFSENGTVSNTPVLYVASSNGHPTSQSVPLTYEAVDGKRHYEANLTSLLINNFNGYHYFALMSIQNVTIYHSPFCSYPPTATLKTINIFDVYYHRYNNPSYYPLELVDSVLTINLFTGGFSYGLDLFNHQNALYSFGLSLFYYSYLSGENSIDGFPTHLPLGFKFSFQQFLYPNGSNYIYIDRNAQKHTFVLPINYAGSTFYYDSDGGYLLLKIFNDHYEVLSVSGDKNIFSLQGYLTSTVIKKGNNEIVINYSYDANNRITGISASNNQTTKTLLTFSYNNSGVSIRPYGENSSLISLYVDSNNHLTSINDRDGGTFAFAYEGDSLLSISRYDMVATLSYNPIYHYLNQIVKSNTYDFLYETVTDSLTTSFIYNLYSCIVSMYVDNDNVHTKDAYYEFDDNGNTLKTYSFFNSKVDALTVNYHTNSEHYVLTSDAATISDNVDSNGNTISYDNNPVVLSNNNSATTYLKILKKDISLNLYLIATSSIKFSGAVLSINVSKGNYSYSKTVILKSSFKTAPILLPLDDIAVGVSNDDIVTIQLGLTSANSSITISSICFLARKDGSRYDISNLPNNSSRIVLENEDNYLKELANSYSVLYSNLTINKNITYYDFLYSLMNHEINQINGLFCDGGLSFIYQLTSVANHTINELEIGKALYISKYFYDAENENRFYAYYQLETLSFDTNQNLFIKKNVSYDYEAERRSLVTAKYNSLLLLIYKNDVNKRETTEYSYNGYGQVLSSSFLREASVGQITYQAYSASSLNAYATNGEKLVSTNQDIDNTHSFKIQYTYNTHNLLTRITNSKNSFFDAVYNYSNKDRLIKTFRYNSNSIEVSSTNITYSDGDVSSIYNNSNDNTFSYTYLKDRTANIITWGNYEESLLEWYEYVSNLSDIVFIRFHNYMSDVYDIFGRPISLTLSNDHSIAYFYRKRNQNLDEVIDGEYGFIGNLAKDQVLGGELDHYTNLLLSYEYSEGDVLSHIACRDTNNSEEEGIYVFTEDEYDCYFGGGRESYGGYYGSYTIQSFTNCLHPRFEKTLNLFDTDKGLVKIYIYPDTINQSEMHIMDNLFYGPNNASQVFDEYILLTEQYGETITSSQPYSKSYEFLTKNDINTPFISSESFKPGNVLPGSPRIINYSYNNPGLISAISSTSYGISHQYTYSFNRLASDSSTRFGNLQYDFANDGTLTMIKKNNSAIYTFSYNSKFQLTSMYHSGVTYNFTYNSRGCPTQYKSKTLSFSMDKMTQYDNVTFDYNSYGQRIRKGNTKYVYQLGKLIYEIRNYDTSNEKVIEYIYGIKDIIGFIYDGNYYVYHRNLLGDITAIYLGNDPVAIYDYDAWGNHIVLNPDGTENTSPSTFVGHINPYRYRGYYYDVETCLYYLKARYYDSETCRFISPDGLTFIELDKINGTNLYIYCHNNPIMYRDENGHYSVLVVVALLSLAFLAGGLSQLAYNSSQEKQGTELWRGVAGASFGSLVNMAALIAAPFSGGATLVFAAVVGSLTTASINIVEKTIYGENINWRRESINLLTNFASNLAGNYIGAKLIPINTGWFQPQHLSSFFMKSYGQRLIAQQVIGSTSSFLLNSAVDSIDGTEDEPFASWFWRWIYG